MITLPPESRLAKLRRLQAEIAELENEISQDGDTPNTRSLATRPSVLAPRTKVDVVGELSNLRSRLSHAAAAVEDGFSPVPPEQEGDLVKRLRQLETQPSEHSNMPRAQDTDHQRFPISDVDKRLSSLEDLVGIATSTDEGVSDEIWILLIIRFPCP